MRRAALFIVVTSALVATAQAHRTRLSDHSGKPVSRVIYPAQELPLEFSHVEHLTKKKLNCGFCHDAAQDSQSSLDNLIPGEDSCELCHDDFDRGSPDERCAYCHTGYRPGGPVARVRILAPNLKFSHANHVQRKMRCQTCHGELVDDNVALATRDQLPRMSLCLTCHNGTEAPAACTTCHLADPGGMVRTVYPEGPLRPTGTLRGDDHGLNWLQEHARVAVNDADYCASCHRKEFCIGCHNGAVKPMDFHGNDYLTLHAIDARRNAPDCSACHRRQTFCVGCHSRVGVTADGKGSEFLGPSTGDLTRRFHPTRWVEFSGGPVRGVGARGADHHAFEAQRNIQQCAACHREEFCTGCHTNEPSNPWRVNPHPADWRGSRRCKALAARAGRMCLRCHVDPTEASCDWVP